MKNKTPSGFGPWEKNCKRLLSTFKSLFLFVLHSRRRSQTAATDTSYPSRATAFPQFRKFR